MLMIWTFNIDAKGWISSGGCPLFKFRNVSEEQTEYIRGICITYVVGYNQIQFNLISVVDGRPVGAFEIGKWNNARLKADSRKG